MSTPDVPGLLPPEEIAKLGNLTLRARAVVEGVFSGIHRSPHRGASRDFTDHKEYSPGDDVRHLDWKAYARFDRPLIRRYESETELGCLLLLDVSPSMDYGGGALTKVGFARILAAALAFVLLRQHDRVGLGLVSDQFRLAVPVGGRGDQLSALLAALESCKTSGGADLAEALGAAAEVAPRRGLVVLLSDLLDPRPDLAAALRLLAVGQRELVVFHVLSPEELEFPFGGFRRFVSEEQPDIQLDADAHGLRQGYLDALLELRQSIARTGQEAGFPALLATTSAPPARVLVEWILGRARRREGTMNGAGS